jgi:two-component system response regulator YesN
VTFVIKLLVVDDEPLVCAGVSGLVNWADFGVELIGTAANGAQAAELIEKERPHIVISDIKMPIKNGLDLAVECGEKYGRVPLFIMLTSYEEFEYAHKALKAHVADYLIKLELTKESLAASVNKVIAELEHIDSAASAKTETRAALTAKREMFFMRLYNDVFESDEQYSHGLKDAVIDFPGTVFCTAVFMQDFEKQENMSADKLQALYSSAAHMIGDTLSKIYACHLTFPLYDAKSFVAAICLDETEDNPRPRMENFLRKICEQSKSYFGVIVRAAVGTFVKSPRELHISYSDLRRLIYETDARAPIIFAQDVSIGEAADDFSFTRIRPMIVKALKDNDADLFNLEIANIVNFFNGRSGRLVQAIDAASNITYLVRSYLHNGDAVVEHVFAGESDGSCALYRLRHKSEVLEWLSRLCANVCGALKDNRQSYAQSVIEHVKAHIQQNLDKRLGLKEVASAFGFSPNYLSQLFAKTTGEGYVEYITHARIEAAKLILMSGKAKIYEVSERVGFENALYFSKVFKKATGISPRQYLYGSDYSK